MTIYVINNKIDEYDRARYRSIDIRSNQCTHIESSYSCSRLLFENKTANRISLTDSN
jgi:hypothetical protein